MKSKTRYYNRSQPEGNERALGKIPADTQTAFVHHIQEELLKLKKHNLRSVKKIAAGYGIIYGQQIKELTELAIVNAVRLTANDRYLIPLERYQRIVSLYNHQTNLSYRNSETYLLQQYSTPAPVAYVMGLFCGLDKLHESGGKCFEPSAGNGLLTIAAQPGVCVVNEISNLRNANLRKQGYARVTQQDAQLPVEEAFGNDYIRAFDAVLTNPPFGRLNKPVNKNGFIIRHLDHIMALNALDAMKDNGRAAIIIGGHNTYDKLGRLSKGKNRILLNYLHHYYHVADVIQLDGKRLYTRQGTGFDVRLILISGRKKIPDGQAPLQEEKRDKVITDFDELYDRTVPYFPPEPATTGPGQTDTYLPQPLSPITQSPMSYEQRLFTAKQKMRSILQQLQSGGLQGTTEFDEFEKFTPELYIRKMPAPYGKTHIQVIKKENGLVYHANKTVKRAAKGTGFPQLMLANSKPLKRPFTLEATTVDRWDVYCLMVLAQDYVEYFGYTLSGLFAAANESLSKEHKKRLLSIGQWEGVVIPTTWTRQDYERLYAALKSIGNSELSDALQQHFNFDKRLKSFDQRLDDTEYYLGAVYNPQSGGRKLDTHVPDSMAEETQAVLKRIEQEVGGDIDNFVRDRLHYPTKEALYNALSAEQIDAVALAIYNIEALNQSLIVGDMTGIGKGRVAAAMIRYGAYRDKLPVFITVQANLFSDIYRDLNAIGSGHLVPFIVNAKEDKTDIKDEDGRVVYSAKGSVEQNRIFESGELPALYDYVAATYSQFNSPEKRGIKRHFLQQIVKGSILILDESHNASGTGNTGQFMQRIIEDAEGVLFLSATYAKEPANMPVYARKTCIAEASITKDGLVYAFAKGGVALQEVVASMIVKEGQMIRRERTYEGIEVNYITLTEKSYEHHKIADNITDIIRDIINFQERYVNPVLDDLDMDVAKMNRQVTERSGTEKVGLDSKPYYSKVFQVIHQMLFSIKAEDVAKMAIEHLRAGRKPVIAFSSTMASFVDELARETGIAEEDGVRISADFSYVLQKGLDSVLRYSIIEMNGGSKHGSLGVEQLSLQGQNEYERIRAKIAGYTSGITISPIDVIVETIRNAGYRVAEVTGRQVQVELSANRKTGLVKPRKRMSTFDAFRLFNDNQVDVLLINQSGSTGASAHAIATRQVPKEEVRQRVMLVLQAELDINQEIQKRGRINRTGQLLKPRYDYITSAIPAEQRLLMMLQEKLKSLDANTTSNQKQSAAMLHTTDFLNKYGNQIVKEYLADYPEVNNMLGDPTNSNRDDFAHFVTGRVAILPVRMQEDFYREVTQRYLDEVEYLKQMNEYTLEMETLNLQAQTLNRQPLVFGKGGYSDFGGNSYLENVEANILRKPMTGDEIRNFLNRNNGNADLFNADAIEQVIRTQIQNEQQQINLEYDTQQALIPTKGKFIRLQQSGDEQALQQYMDEQLDEIAKRRRAKLEKTETSYMNRLHYMNRVIDYFKPGFQLFYPVGENTEQAEMIMAIFLGYQINPNSKNPYTPSAIKMQFALNSTHRLISIPLSKQKEINAIIGANVNNAQSSYDDYVEDWDDERTRLNRDRHKRYIITGNLLQAIGKYKGRLVSYTLLEGGEAKGILTPESWEPTEEDLHISIPIHRAFGYIRALTNGRSVNTNNGISIIRTGADYKLVVSANRKKGGDIYTDEELLKWVTNNNFENISGKMQATILYDDMESILKVLQDKHNTSINLPKADVNMDTHRPVGPEKKYIQPPKPFDKAKADADRLRLLKLKAQAVAVALKLKLL